MNGMRPSSNYLLSCPRKVAGAGYLLPPTAQWSATSPSCRLPIRPARQARRPLGCGTRHDTLNSLGNMQRVAPTGPSPDQLLPSPPRGVGARECAIRRLAPQPWPAVGSSRRRPRASGGPLPPGYVLPRPRACCLGGCRRAGALRPPALAARAFLLRAVVVRDVLQHLAEVGDQGRGSVALGLFDDAPETVEKAPGILVLLIGASVVVVLVVVAEL